MAAVADAGTCVAMLFSSHVCSGRPAHHMTHTILGEFYLCSTRQTFVLVELLNGLFCLCVLAFVVTSDGKSLAEAERTLKSYRNTQ